MNRILKFRAWNKGAKCWLIWTMPESGTDVDLFAVNTFLLCADLSTVYQYTGLKDKNGREIYEGDVVERVTHDSWGDHLCYGRQVVIWHNSAWSLSCNYSMSDVEFLPPLHGIAQDCRVVGNVYENPELAKEKP